MSSKLFAGNKENSRIKNLPPSHTCFHVKNRLMLECESCMVKFFILFPHNFVYTENLKTRINQRAPTPGALFVK